MSDRREFFAKSLKAICLCAGGGFLASMALKANDSYYLRPPGADDEDEFLSKCIRCGLCVKACPYDTLKLASVFDSAKTGTPFLKLEKSLAICVMICLVLGIVLQMLLIISIWICKTVL